MSMRILNVPLRLNRACLARRGSCVHGMTYGASGHIWRILINDCATMNIDQHDNNNIIWNLAHLTATQQRICYLRAGLKPVVQEHYVTPFLSGTKPEGLIDSAEIETIKSLFISSVEELESDYKKSFFPNYEEYTTRYGVTLTNIDDAINFLPYHEGYHTGVIIELMKLV
ncbi:MAG: DinB family protein [Sphingobacteriaceae bacterium]|nr:MAG: DinB family protein [Sphingobacteriaceae bacterium]